MFDFSKLDKKQVMQRLITFIICLVIGILMTISSIGRKYAFFVIGFSILSICGCIARLTTIKD
jgi:hypothetical protein